MSYRFSTESEIMKNVPNVYLSREQLEVKVATTIHKNNGTNDKFYRKVAILMYTEMFNFRPQN